MKTLTISEKIKVAALFAGMVLISLFTVLSVLDFFNPALLRGILF
ncbi:hypothetical protein [Sunxiuqinia indica]|nr:hypothetical protein [Sunxiuqinia indica]